MTRKLVIKTNRLELPAHIKNMNHKEYKKIGLCDRNGEIDWDVYESMLEPVYMTPEQHLARMEIAKRGMERLAMGKEDIPFSVSVCREQAYRIKTGTDDWTDNN